MVKRLCPLKWDHDKPHFAGCEEKMCMWWIPQAEECAVAVIGWYLNFKVQNSVMEHEKAQDDKTPGGV